MTDEAPWLLPYLPPVPPNEYDGGYEWAERLNNGDAGATPGGWVVVPVWGRHGWDLGEWPYVMVATCAVVIDVEEPRPLKRPEQCIHCRQLLTLPGPVWVAEHGGAECPATLAEHAPARQSRVYGVCTYVEGDIEVRAYAGHEERIRELDNIAAFYWRLKERESMEHVAPVGPLPVEYSGPFSWERSEREKEAS